MTAPQLARRLGTTRQAVSALERREVLGTVSLEALRRAAAALDCELVYAVVPRTDLRAMRELQARRYAERQLNRVAHSMRLESQTVDPSEHRRQVAERTDELLRTWSRALWDELDREDKQVPRNAGEGMSPSMRKLLAARRPGILAAAAAGGARNVRLFGSAARGEEGADSDVDFVVSLDPGRTLLDLTRIETRLEQLMGRRVDVVTEESVREPIRSTALREAVRV